MHLLSSPIRMQESASYDLACTLLDCSSMLIFDWLPAGDTDCPLVVSPEVAVLDDSSRTIKEVILP